MATAARFTLVIFSVAMRIYASISMARMTSVISFILLYSLHFERKGNNYFVIANISVSFFNEFNSFSYKWKFRPLFLSPLFFFPLHFHHRIRWKHGSQRRTSQEEISRRKLSEYLKGYAYIYNVFPRRNPPKIVILVKYY